MALFVIGTFSEVINTFFRVGKYYLL